MTLTQSRWTGMPLLLCAREPVSLEQICDVALRDRPVALAPSALELLGKGRSRLETKIEAGELIYGINTGLGGNSHLKIPKEQLQRHQSNLLAFLSAGTGEPLALEQVRGAQLLTLLALIQGWSAIRPELTELLVEHLNRGIVPLAPRHGSVGASGDLIPPSYIDSALRGLDRVHYDGRKLDAEAALSWIGTWAASPQATWGSDFAFPTKIPATLQDQTLRQVARISLGGKRIRIVLSNEFGTRPLVIGAARVALAGTGSAIIVGTDRAITFGGKPSVTVPPGAPIMSDPVDLVVGPMSSVAVSVFLPDETLATTFHRDGRQTAYLVRGNQAAAERVEADTTTGARIFLSGIQVEAAGRASAVVVIGDSITDGNGATLDANARWPDFLAARLAPRNVAVLNAGISGARLLGDRMGANALARFDRDVLSQAGLRSVIVLLGINDISWPGTAFEPQGTRPTADALISGYRQLIARAHTRGVRIVGATLTPFEGAMPGTPLDNYYNADKDKLRQQVNTWIRSGEFDAVLDFDALVRDPQHPTRLKPEFDSGDHLHPGDRGNKAMADAVRLDALF